MQVIKKLRYALGIKGLLAILCLATIATALVNYTVTVTITPVKQFYQGATESSWDIYVNEVNQARYVPGGNAQPEFSSSDTSTYAFKIVTDDYAVCALKIELSDVMNSSKFSSFQITAQYWNVDSWADATLYNAATGDTTKNYVDGLVSEEAAYIHQAVSTTSYYLIKVTYSYDLLDETTQVMLNLQFAPMPKASF